MRRCSCHGCPTTAKTAAARDQIAPWYCPACEAGTCGHEPPKAEPIATPAHEILRLEIAGLAPSRPYLHFSPLVSHVGNVSDGCQLYIPERAWTGPVVIAFSDLTRMYEAAKAAREK